MIRVSSLGVFLSLMGAGSAHAFGVEWIKRISTGGPVAASERVPGLSWLHHESPELSRGPAPRVKYRHRYRSSDRPLAGETSLQSKDLLRTPPDVVISLKQGGTRVGVTAASEVRILEGEIELLSGGIWLESDLPFRVRSAHLRVLPREGNALIYLRDDEHSRERVEVSVLRGSVQVRTVSENGPDESLIVGAEGEKILIRYPGGSQGVDNQRFFSAMEPEPEVERAKIPDEDRAWIEKIRATPVQPKPEIP